MGMPKYVSHWRPGRDPEILERDHDGDYVTWLVLPQGALRRAREVVRGLNELEARRARDRRARKRRSKS